MPNKKLKMSYTKDEFGKEVLLRNGNLQVMMEWEKPYMEACIDALKPTGDVLEIGFGLGYSATQIQKHKPKSHTIIENDPEVLKKAKEWAKKHPGVKIVEGTWQEKLPELGQFDAIFFDDYSPLTAEEIEEMKKNSQKLTSLKNQAQELTKKIDENLKSYEGLQFTDQEVNDFGKQMLKRKEISPDDILQFMHRLEKQRNITSKQKTDFIKTYGKEFEKRAVETEKIKSFPGDRFINFALECLDKHMHKGSKLSGYMGSPKSKANHPEFEQFILSRKDVNYSEKTIPINVSSNCQYYDENEVLVIVIQKK